jgi:hypothetical protein
MRAVFFGKRARDSVVGFHHLCGVMAEMSLETSWILTCFDSLPRQTSRIMYRILMYLSQIPVPEDSLILDRSIVKVSSY